MQRHTFRPVNNTNYFMVSDAFANRTMLFDPFACYRSALLADNLLFWPPAAISGFCNRLARYHQISDGKASIVVKNCHNRRSIFGSRSRLNNRLNGKNAAFVRHGLVSSLPLTNDQYAAGVAVNHRVRLCKRITDGSCFSPFTDKGVTLTSDEGKLRKCQCFCIWHEKHEAKTATRRFAPYLCSAVAVCDGIPLAGDQRADDGIRTRWRTHLFQVVTAPVYRYW